MLTLKLTADEVSELQEHLHSRPDIWTANDNVWLRTVDAVPALAVKIQNGLPDDCYAFIIRAVSWSEGEAYAYGRWLLRKYTMYEERLRLQELLQPAVKEDVNTLALARDIIKGGYVQERSSDDGSRPQDPAAVELSPVAPAVGKVAAGTKPRSLYLQRLTGQR